MNIINYIFIAIIILIFYKLFICEKFDNNIYLTKLELEKTLINNKDKYYDTFNTNDFKVRNINNIEDYYNIIKESCINISDQNAKLIDNAILISNEKIKKINLPGFSGKKAAGIQWTIGIIKNKKYEYGLPHTRNNIIIIPESIIKNESVLIRVLIHEKIHIYQKLFPLDTEDWLKSYGFEKYRIKNKQDNIRANPDVNNYIYKDNEGKVLEAKYNEEPFTINDVKYYPTNNYYFEHPYEYMAYTLEDMINI